MNPEDKKQKSNAESVDSEDVQINAALEAFAEYGEDDFFANDYEIYED